MKLGVNIPGLLVCIMCCIPSGQGAPASRPEELKHIKKHVKNADDAKMYLQRYNHMGRDNMKTGELMTEDDFVTAIESFQTMANLNITGDLDDATMEMMNQPRCGMPDNMGYSHSTRRKRYAALSRWETNDLSWRIIPNQLGVYTGDIADSDTKRIMREALQIWSDVSALNFRESATGSADFDIFFAAGSHGDGNPFDGPGSVLAHAYFPSSNSLGGDAHFDDDELFTQNTRSGINLFQVAAHEFGHSLGLGHSDDEDALMYAFYRGYIPNFQLQQDDINGIQYLYGVNSGMPDATMKPATMPICPADLDTMATTHDWRTFAFIGDLVYQILTDGVAAGYPKPITEIFSGLPNNIDAAFYYPQNGRTYFFKGSQYWRYSSTSADAGYPRPISAWGLPSNIDAALVWSENGRIYFFKDNQYYRYDSRYGRIDRGYPQPLSRWGLPEMVTQIDAAFQWQVNRRTYFFVGDQYYRYNDDGLTIDDSYPRPTAFWWFGCGENSNSVLDHADDGSMTTEETGGSLPTCLPSVFALSLCIIGAHIYHLL